MLGLGERSHGLFVCGNAFPDNVERMSGFGCYAEFLFINQCGKGMRDGDS